MAESSAATENEATRRQKPLPSGWLSNWPWVTFLLPMLVFMVGTSFEPTPPTQFEADGTLPAEQTLEQTLGEGPEDGYFISNSEGLLPAISYRYYPHVYAAKLLLTGLAMLLVLPGYRTFPWRVSWLSVGVGVVGVMLWIVLCHLRLEPLLIGPIDRLLGSIVQLLPGLASDETPTVGLLGMLGTGQRSSFNPLVEMAESGIWAYVFLAIRFVGLALIVPVIEEFFLRGFVMRFVVHPQWWQVPFGEVNRLAVIAGTAVPMLMHPGELLAALVWFSLVTWLMVRTRNIWDCVIAHAVTNFLLGVYVVLFDQWQLM